MFESTGETRLVVMPLLDRSLCRDCRNGLTRGAVNEEAYWAAREQVADKVGSGKKPPVVTLGVRGFGPCLKNTESLCLLTTAYGISNLGKLDDERVLEIGNCVLALLNY